MQTGTEAVLKDEGVDLCIGNNRKKDLISILEAYFEEQDKTIHDTTVIDINHTAEYEEMTLTKTAEHTRAYIKIQDGCNQFCSYCIIPYARGRVRSRKMEDILAEVRGLVENGYQEIVFTGIHISSYGIDFSGETASNGMPKYTGKSKLLELIKEIHKIEGLKRIRLGSLEPRIISEEFATELSKLEKVCPHFHLSLQSGCNATLKRMNRHYSAEEYYEKVELLRRVYKNPAITTDVIVGFPGETEEEFKETEQFLEKICFYEMHVFKYSKRQGTPAATMANQVPDGVKQERSARLLDMERKQSKEFRTNKIGTVSEVLFEEAKVINGETYQIGHTAEYIKVAKKETKDLSNCLINGKITGFLEDDILFME